MTPRRPRGFTLVELMVSTALGLLIVLALVTMLINVNRNNTELNNTSRLVENGRFAAQLLASDLSHAGFWAGYVPNHDSLKFTAAPALASVVGGSVPTAVPNPCLPYSAGNWSDEYKANLLGIPVQAGEVAANGTAPFCSGLVNNAKPGNDVLVVRHAETCVAGSGSNECGNTAAATSPDLYFQASYCGSDARAFVLSTNGLNLRKRNCTAAADLRRFASSLYYVRDNGPNSPPALVRSSLSVGDNNAAGRLPLHQDAQAVVEGVEAFRVEFGIDSVSASGGAVTATAAISWGNEEAQSAPNNRGDGIPDGAYVHCTQAAPCTPYQLMNAVAARIHVLVRAERKTAGYVDGKTYHLGSTTLGPFNDGYKRHLFTQTVRFVNVSGRRETP